MPLQFQQLGGVKNLDPSAVNALAGLVANKKIVNQRDRTALANLLGTGITAGAGLLNEQLKNRNSQQQGLDALRIASESGIIPPIDEDLLKDRGLTSTSANTIITQGGLATNIRNAKNIADLGESFSRAGLAEGDQAFNLGTKVFKNIQDRFGDDPEKAQAAVDRIVKKVLDDTSGQTGSSQLKGGVVATDVPDAPQGSTNLVGRQAQAKTEKAELDAQQAKVDASISSPDYLYGPGNKTGADISRNPQVEAIDPFGIPLGVPMTEGLLEGRQRYARKSAKSREEVDNAVSTSLETIDNFTRNRDNVLKFKQDGTLKRLRTKVLSNGAFQYVLPDNPSEELKSTILFLNNSFALATGLARSAGNTGTSLSDKDVQGFRNLVGDPNTPVGIFESQTDEFLAKVYVGAMRNAALSSGATFKELRRNYQGLTGEDIPNNFMTNTSFITKAKQGFTSQRHRNNQARLRQAVNASPAAQAPNAPAPTAQGSTMDTIQQIDEILRQQGAL